MERRGESVAAIAGGPAHSQRRGLHRGDSWRIPALAILCPLMIAPLIMAVIISFKSPSQFTRVPFLPTLPLRWENYEFAVQVISQFLLNSVITSGATVIGVLLLSSLAAYSFAQIPFPGRTPVFYAVLALMMVPASLTLVPSFVLVRDLRLINTHWSLILAVDRRRTDYRHPDLARLLREPAQRDVRCLPHRRRHRLADLLACGAAVDQVDAGRRRRAQHPRHLEQPDLADPDPPGAQNVAPHAGALLLHGAILHQLWPRDGRGCCSARYLWCSFSSSRAASSSKG